MPKACPYVMRCQRLVATLYYDVICTRHMLSPSTILGRRVGLGLEPKGLDFAADGDDIAGGDGAHDEHCHHD